MEGAAAVPPPAPACHCAGGLAPGIPGAFDRTYVINLDGATERWEAVQRHCARAGIAPTRIPAVRGRALTPEERRAEATASCTAFCAPTTLGVAVSHTHAWKRLLEDGAAAALILEDDAEFVDDFRERLLRDVVPEIPADTDVLYLGCVGCSDETPAAFSAAFRLVGMAREGAVVSPHIRRPPTAICMHAYVVTAAGARKLLAAIEGRIDDHIDKMLNAMMLRGELTCYSVEPLLAFQEISNAATSNAVAKTPRGPNRVADACSLDRGVTLGYVLNVSIAQVGDYTVNMWSAIMLATGLGLGALGAGALLGLVVCLLIFALDLVPLFQGDRATVVSVLVSALLIAAGWALGAALRAGVRALAGACRRGGGGSSRGGGAAA